VNSLFLCLVPHRPKSLEAVAFGTGIQYVEHAEGHGDKLFSAACNLGLEGIVSKKLNAPYRSGPSKTWIKVKNPKAPAATRAVDGTF
jgi:ATP-dependent DNA ligase